MVALACLCHEQSNILSPSYSCTFVWRILLPHYKVKTLSAFNELYPVYNESKFIYKGNRDIETNREVSSQILDGKGDLKRRWL